MARFNPRVRAGRDVSPCGFPGLVSVSIHASARDATFYDAWDYGSILVSIHASARDATQVSKLPHMYLQFQSTRPRGTRQGRITAVYAEPEFQSTRPRGTRHGTWWMVYNVSVSIHASARDATRAYPSRLYPFPSEFQSTRPRGTRPCSTDAEVLMPCFNPRVRAGRDGVFLLSRSALFVSIHASARDATRRLHYNGHGH